MKFNEYIELASRTCKPMSNVDHVSHMCLGIIGELGEVVDLYKKHWAYDKPLDRDALVEEFGDILWYCAGLYNTAEKFYKIPPDRCVEQQHSFRGSRKYYSNNPTHILHLSLSISPHITTIIKLVNFPSLTDTYNNSYDIKCHCNSIMAAILDMMSIFDLNFSEVMEKNIKKLASRYGDKYSDYNAINRSTDVEQVAMNS